MHRPEPPRSVDDDGPRHRVRLPHYYLRLLRQFLASPITMGCLVSLVLVHTYCVYLHMANTPAKTVCRRERAMVNNGTLPDLATTPLQPSTVYGMFCVAAQYPVCPIERSLPLLITVDSGRIERGDADVFQTGRDVSPEDTPATPCRPPDLPNENSWTYSNPFVDTPAAPHRSADFQDEDLRTSWNPFADTPAARRRPGGFPNGLFWTSGNTFDVFTDAEHSPYDVVLEALGYKTSRSELSPIPGASRLSGLPWSSAVMKPPTFDWFEDFVGCLRQLERSPQSSELLRCFFKTEDVDPVCATLDGNSGPCARCWQLHRQRIALYKQTPGFG